MLRQSPLHRWYGEVVPPVPLDLRADRLAFANRLRDALAMSYVGSARTIERLGIVVTIANGQRAVHIEVLNSSFFRVALRRNDTYHTLKTPVARKDLSRVIERMVGKPTTLRN